MSLLNDASLVFIPSGYKEDKVYSVIPSNGAGDLDFVRGCDATRINPQSLVETTPWNLLNYSENFANAYWTKDNITIISNATTNPINSQNTATAIIGTAVNSYHSLTLASFPISQQLVISIFAKAGSKSNVEIEFGSGQVSFNLSNATINYQTNATGSIENLGNGWHKLTAIVPSCSYIAFIVMPGTGTSEGWLGDGATTAMYYYGAQANIGSTAKPYFPTTDRLNVPRLDYTNSTCPSLLLEKQSINISQFAEVGTGGFLAATVTNGTELLGLKTFKILTDNTAYGDSPYINTNTEYQANTAYTLSFYTDFSKSNGTTISASMLGFFPGVAYAGITINKSTKSITTFNVGGIWTINSYTANQISGEIYRIVVTCTPNATSAGGSRNYINADNTFYAEVCGVQVEASVYPTSYIYKPASTSVTRLADSCYKTGISSLIGQTSGTMFIDAYIDNIEARSANIICYLKGTGVDKYILIFNNGGVRYDDYPSVSIANYSYGLTNGRHKFAIAYAQNDFAFYIDGNLIGTSNSGTPAVCSDFGFYYYASGYDFPLKANEVLLFKRRLTNTELAQLTTI